MDPTAETARNAAYKRRRRAQIWRRRQETAAGDGGEGTWPERFDGADGASTENGMHPRREYDNLASEATERVQARAGADAGGDSHGSTETSAGRRRAE